MPEFTTYPISDLRIRVAVQASLRKHLNVDLSQVAVNVEGGEVSLRGIVVGRVAAEQAFADAAAVDGVRLVRRGLSIRRRAPSGGA
jgi:osmotically-inducible protein OsmY